MPARDGPCSVHGRAFRRSGVYMRVFIAVVTIIVVTSVSLAQDNAVEMLSKVRDAVGLSRPQLQPGRVGAVLEATAAAEAWP